MDWGHQQTILSYSNEVHDSVWQAPVAMHFQIRPANTPF